MRSEKDPVKEHERTRGIRQGRAKGSLNKYTADIKNMVEKALSMAGGVDYLVKQAHENPVAFMNLVGKLMPKQVNAKIDTDFNISVITGVPKQDALKVINTIEHERAGHPELPSTQMAIDLPFK